MVAEIMLLKEMAEGEDRGFSGILSLISSVPANRRNIDTLINKFSTAGLLGSYHCCIR
jgi:hypothetical protein